MSDNSLPPMRSVAAARLANDLIAGSVKSPDWPENVLSRQAKSAAMDALIADSADMIAPVGEVERVAKALADADGLDWGEVCGMDADPDEGYCDSGTCVAAHWEEHDAEQARCRYMHLATAALSAMSPAGEVERLRETLLNVRGKNAANFDRNGAAWEAYDRAVLDCIAAIEGLARHD